MLKKLINKIDKDKIIHSYVSTILTCLIYPFIKLLFENVNVCVIISAVIVLLIGIGKELLDKRTEGNQFEIKDIVADIIGIIIAIVIIYCFNIE